MIPLVNIKKHDFPVEVKADADNIYDALEQQFSKELVAEQIALEHEQYFRGEQRFMKRLEYDREHGRAIFNPLFKAPATAWWNATTAEIVERNKLEAEKTRDQYRMPWFKLTRDAKPEVLASVTLTTVLGELFEGSYASAHTMWERVGKAIEKELRFTSVRLAEVREWDERYGKQLRKRKSDLNRQEYLKRLENDFIDEGKLNEWSKWSRDDQVKVGFEMCCAVEKATGVFQHKQIPQQWLGHKTQSKKFITALVLNPQWVERIHDLAHTLAAREPEYLPMVIPPKPWTNFSDGGYWSKGNKPFNMVQSFRRRNVVKLQAKRKMPLVMEAMNILQNTPWQVNHDVLKVVRELYDNDDKVEVTKLISKWPNAEASYGVPFPVGGSEEEIDLWKWEAHKFYQEDKKRQSRRKGLKIAVEQATRFAEYDRFYMPYFCDFRGRLYAAPSFNPQGGDVMKALLVIADKKPMGERGWYWLKVHTATTGEVDGMDKAELDERAAWTDKHRDEIIATSLDPIGMAWFWTQSDNPFQFLAACIECGHAWLSGNPEQFESGLVVAFDGSCSGLQHYSAMLRDEEGGAQVNLVPSTKRADVYNTVCDKLRARLEYDAAMGDSEGKQVVDENTGEIKYLPSVRSMARNWLDFGISRKTTKRPVMTYCYSSKEYGMKEQTMTDIISPAKTDENEEQPLFKYAGRHAWYLADAIYTSTGDVVVKASECMDYLQQVTALLRSEGKPLEWITQDGFYMRQEYLEQEAKQMDLKMMVSKDLPRIRFSPQFMVDGEKIGGKQCSSVAPNFIHSMDATHLRMTVRTCAKKGIRNFGVIHDSFGVVPADAQVMFDTVRETMVAMYADDNQCMLAQVDRYVREHVSAEKQGEIPTPPTKGKLDLAGILSSQYAFS